MFKFSKMFVGLLVIGLFFNVSVSLASVSSSCSLFGAAQKDSVWTASTVGSYVKLSMTCHSNSKYGTMAVIRGRMAFPNSNLDHNEIWLMYPALKCKIGGTASTKKNIYAYAKGHGGGSYSNLFSVRQYGNHCDNQKTGCIGTAIAVNMQS